ncbi:MAG: FAD-dependent oxidoreductase [Cellvibrionaceae bacterium]
MKRESLLVIGNGMVGQKYLECLVAAGLHEHYEVTVLCAEPRSAYDRVHLSEYFRGRTAEQLSLVPAGFFAKHGLTLRLDEAAQRLDLAAKTVTTSRGEVLHYHKLVLATGSYPFVPPVPGHDRPGCLVYRTIEDLEAIMAAGRDGEIGVVVGGGLLGLEAARALRDIGLQTHVVEFAPRLMAVQVDDDGGALLRRKIEQLGVLVHTGMNTREIGDGEFHRHRLNFADGSRLETDLVVFSAGIRPQDALAREAGLAVGERGGIVVDNYCRSADPDIYSIGECALWEGRIHGLVAPGYEMARVAVSHLESLSKESRGIQRGGPPQFTGADMSTKLKLMGVDVASVGDAHAATPGACCYRYADERSQTYKKLVVSEDGRTLLGAVLVGDTRDYSTLLQLMLNRIDLPEHPEDLILPRRQGAAPLLDVRQLPDSATLCTCQNVSKGTLRDAILAGNANLAALKTSTGAATGCGGCATLIEDMLEDSVPLYVEARG